MKQKTEQKEKRSWTCRYRFGLAVLLTVVLILLAWYCVTSYQQNTPKEGTLVHRVRQVKQYERKA